MTSDGIPALRVAPPGRVYLVLLAGLMAVSLGAIFARLAQDAGLPSLLIAAGRLTISALLLTPFVLIRHRAPLRELGRRDLTLAAGAGLFLALHFATWIASLEYTSVLISVVLVSTGPLWVALLEVVFLHARLNRLIVVGLGVAFAGGRRHLRQDRDHERLDGRLVRRLPAQRRRGGLDRLRHAAQARRP